MATLDNHGVYRNMARLPDMSKQPGLVAMAQEETDESLEKATRQDDGAYALPPVKPRPTADEDDEDDPPPSISVQNRKERFGGPGKGNPNLRKPASWPSSSPDRSGKSDKQSASHRPGSAPHRRQAAGLHRNRDTPANDRNNNQGNGAQFKKKYAKSNDKKTNGLFEKQHRQNGVERDVTDESIATRLSFDKNQVNDNGPKGPNSNARFFTHNRHGTTQKVHSKVGSSYVVKSQLGPSRQNRLFSEYGNESNELVDLRLKLLNDYITLHEPTLRKKKKPKPAATKNARNGSTDASELGSDSNSRRDRYKDKVNKELIQSKQSKKPPHRTVNRSLEKPYGIQGYGHLKSNRSMVDADPQKLREGLTTPVTTSKVYNSRPVAKLDLRWYKERSDMYKIRNYANEEHVLTDNEAGMYIQIRDVYKDRTLNDRERRKLEFLKKVESLQQDFANEMNRQLRTKDAKDENKRHIQNEQLYFIRKRFMEEQVKRWRTQYVTSKVLQHEKNDRFVYGLPELFDEIPHYTKPTRKRRKAVDADTKKKNAKRYGQIFVRNTSPVVFRVNTPKMESYVIIQDKDEKGNTVEKRIRMKDVVNDAKKVLKIPTAKDIEEEADDDEKSNLSRSTRASLQSLDLDDQEDIFEKARRKYGIDIDSEDSDPDDY